MKTKVENGSMGLTGILFVAFLVLKLTGVIGWSWWWVTAPLWGSALLGLIFGKRVRLYFAVQKQRK